MPERVAVSTDYEISFGPFRLFPARQLLLENGKSVRLGSRALELLIALAERPNELVTKEDLIARVWPQTFVEEGSLRVHIAALRRALGDGQKGNRYVLNIPGRGYRFVAPLSRATQQEATAPLSILPTYNLPVPPTRMLGRDEIVESISSQLQLRRFITLVGPGGIGKTTVALAIANKLAPSYQDGVCFVDLAPVNDPLLVPSALAFVLGLAVRSDHPIPTLIAAVQNKKMLLVFDSCEHVIDAASDLLKKILKPAPGIHILATSREAMRAEGEHVQRLGPLGVPPVLSGLTSREALAYSAIQLFIERAAESVDAFELTDKDVLVIAEICRRLDGIALAIELAAGRVDTFGVRGVAAHLDDCFRLLTRGRRTALPRHQTLSATLDWSYNFLSENERIVLRRLAIFAGVFSLDAAKEIVAIGEIDAKDVHNYIANLMAKSLVNVHVHGSVAQYRLSDTTRAYCFAKLRQSDEWGLFAYRHTKYFLRLLETPEGQWDAHFKNEELAAYGYHIDNVRAALDWAFSPAGNTQLGTALTVTAMPLWSLLSLTHECRHSAQRALDHTNPGSPETMKLFIALGAALRFDQAPDPEVDAVWTNALSIAENLDNTDYQLRALCGRWIVRLGTAKFREALTIARKFKDVAAKSADPKDSPVGDRMIGFTLHFLGEQAEARQYLEEMINHYGTSAHPTHIIRFGYDQRSTAHNTLAEILWLQGLPDQAKRIVADNVAYIQSLNHELSLCNALHGACPIALFTGDLVTAERYVAMLLERAVRLGLPLWKAAARCFEGVLRIKQGNVVGGVDTLQVGIDQLLETRFVVRYLSFVAELAEALSRIGKIEAGRAAIDDGLHRCERNEELWYLAELLRVKGEILLREGTPQAAQAAETVFLQSLDHGRQQNVLSWQLRTTISLARLWRSRGRLDDARALLVSVYGRFTEGFGTTDLRMAKQFLDDTVEGVRARGG